MKYTRETELHVASQRNIPSPIYLRIFNMLIHSFIYARDITNIIAVIPFKIHIYPSRLFDDKKTMINIITPSRDFLHPLVWSVHTYCEVYAHLLRSVHTYWGVYTLLRSVHTYCGVYTPIRVYMHALARE